MHKVHPVAKRIFRRLVVSPTHCSLSDAPQLLLHKLLPSRERGENTGQSQNGPRRLKLKMVPRGYLGARGLLRVYGGSSGKGKFSMSTDTKAGVEAKLEEYCAKVPTPLSIAEFTERGR